MTIEDRNVIWVASYPKSGNTWVHDVLRTAGKGRGFPQVPMDVYDMQASGRLPQVCPPVRPEFASPPCSVLKTHAIPVSGKALHEFDSLQLHTVGFIYVYRNPLDLLLSYINYTRIEYASNRESMGYARALFEGLLGMDQAPSVEEWAGTKLDDVPQDALDHALQVYADRGLTIPTCFPSLSWARHVRAWMDAATGIPSVVVRYEDCIVDASTFDPMAKFFQFGPKDIRAALGSSADRAAQKAAAGTEQERIFFNKMQAYYYPQYFSGPAIASFVRKHGDVLVELGYAQIAEGP